MGFGGTLEKMEALLKLSLATSLESTVADIVEYQSTNRDLDPVKHTLKVSFREALFMGLAPDGGLFMPVRIPKLPKDELRELRGKPYSQAAHRVLRTFLEKEIDDINLEKIVEGTYDFDVPIEEMDDNTHLMRLDRGPTASFKDFAARFMARIMSHLRPGDRKITVLVATSGDTGSAIGEAYRGLEGFRVYILYPDREVSPIQQLQMEAIGENVTAIALDGKFDDCQSLVRRAFSDPDLGPLNLTSANSINIGRLLPQIAYYVYAYVNTTADFQPVVFSIPSGNFGNSLGCELARRMGLPVKKLLIAVNENDEFPRFLESGVYEKVDPSRVCLSNAMNVGNPSNLARYIDLYGGILTKEGTLHKLPNLEEMRQHLFSTSVNDAATVALIKKMYDERDILVEPHGAVGIVALNRFREGGNRTPAICIETAHPGKFPDILEDLLHVEIDLPPPLELLANREKAVDYLDNDYEQLKIYLLEKA